MGTPTGGVPAQWKVGDKISIRDGYGKGLLALGEERADVVALDADLAVEATWIGGERVL